MSLGLKDLYEMMVGEGDRLTRANMVGVREAYLGHLTTVYALENSNLQLERLTKEHPEVQQTLEKQAKLTKHVGIASAIGFWTSFGAACVLMYRMREARLLYRLAASALTMSIGASLATNNVTSMLTKFLSDEKNFDTPVALAMRETVCRVRSAAIEHLNDESEVDVCMRNVFHLPAWYTTYHPLPSQMAKAVAALEAPHRIDASVLSEPFRPCLTWINDLKSPHGHSNRTTQTVSDRSGHIGHSETEHTVPDLQTTDQTVSEHEDSDHAAAEFYAHDDTRTDADADAASQLLVHVDNDMPPSYFVDRTRTEQQRREKLKRFLENSGRKPE
ncbi:MAG: hypothetical protein MHM6MM_002931 [Cercozoa sp. M6MM]